MCPFSTPNCQPFRLSHAPAQVLPRHGVIPEEDIHYYRILLRLSLDPDPDWWAKFDREAAACDARCGPRGKWVWVCGLPSCGGSHAQAG